MSQDRSPENALHPDVDLPPTKARKKHNVWICVGAWIHVLSHKIYCTMQNAPKRPREFYAPLNIPPLDARLYRLRKIVTWAGDPRKMDL